MPVSCDTWLVGASLVLTQPDRVNGFTSAPAPAANATATQRSLSGLTTT
jgi:hypothetical protein